MPSTPDNRIHLRFVQRSSPVSGAWVEAMVTNPDGSLERGKSIRENISPATFRGLDKRNEPEGHYFLVGFGRGRKDKRVYKVIDWHTGEQCHAVLVMTI
jgi:hypothetical protein